MRGGPQKMATSASNLSMRLAYSLIGVACLAGSGGALAQGHPGTSKPAIRAADALGGKLFIEGTNFGTGRPPVVQVGATVLAIT